MGLPFVFYNFVENSALNYYPTGYDLWISQAVPTAKHHSRMWATGSTYTLGSNEVQYGQYEPWYGFRRMSMHIGGNDPVLESGIYGSLTGWRDGYSVPNSAGVPGYYNYTDGFRLDWVLNADTGSRYSCLDHSISASFTVGSNFTTLSNEETNREVSYALLSYINSEVFCGTGHNSRTEPYIQFGVGDIGEFVSGSIGGTLTGGGHIEQWLGGLQTDSNGDVVPGTEDLHNFRAGSAVTGLSGVFYDQGFAAFMGAITAWSLISAVENSGNISGGIPSGNRIVTKIERLFDGMWPYYWVPENQSMKYRWSGLDAGGLPIPITGGSIALNNEIAPIYWWLYKKTGRQRHLERGDALFHGTIGYLSLNYSGALGAVYLSKEFNELVRWIFDGLEWRREGVTIYG